ncbi:MAG: GtrA family protein [Chitinophagaceae bacterium]|nr:GtrA family protein [Chitinophagaceae bacterium]
MSTFLKAQASSLIATCTDFLITIILKEVFSFWYVLANIIGVISGGIANFYINKDWVFNGKTNTVKAQAIRYFVVWLGNLLLNALGVFLLTKFGHFNYIISKIVVSLLLGWTYNYFLQKNYVFK